MNLNKKNGYFVTSLEKAGDPIRTNLWKLNFDFSELRRYEENLGTNFNIFDSETLSLLVKDYQPPTVEMNSEAIYFQGGAKKILPTTVEHDDTLVVTIQENNKLVGYKNLMRWMQYCVNSFSFSPDSIGEEATELSQSGFNNVFGYGSPIYKNKDNEVIGNFFINNHTMFADLFDYTTGDAIVRFSYINVFPVKLTPPKLDYNSSNLYQFQAEFKYSRYIYTLPTKNRAIIDGNSYTSQAPKQWGYSN